MQLLPASCPLFHFQHTVPRHRSMFSPRGGKPKYHTVVQELTLQISVVLSRYFNIYIFTLETELNGSEHSRNIICSYIFLTLIFTSECFSKYYAMFSNHFFGNFYVMISSRIKLFAVFNITSQQERTSHHRFYGIVFFNWPTPCSRTTSLGLTHPDRNEYQESSWGVKGGRPARKADNLTAFYERIV
jgi:hypothetical protein